jgi:hypothetical protein
MRMPPRRLAVVLALVAAGCAPSLPPRVAAQQAPATSAAPPVASPFDALLANPADDAAFERLKDVLPHNDARTRFIVEGDMELTEAALRSYVERMRPGTPPLDGQRSRELAINRVDGTDDLWPRGRRTLTYAVDRPSFAASEYAAVVQNLRQAGDEWNRVCGHCEVRFQHLDAFDAAPSIDRVTFVVTRNRRATLLYVAEAFYPHEAKQERYLRVDPAYFTTRLNRVGVFRHEFGHILGYRHEYVPGVTGCAPEAGELRRLTLPTRDSVMHYFCGNEAAADLPLDITNIDRTGHTDLYGKP